jgi:hypothetical protein
MSSCRSSCGSGVGGALTRVRNPSTALLRSTSLRIGTRPRSSSARSNQSSRPRARPLTSRCSAARPAYSAPSNALRGTRYVDSSLGPPLSGPAHLLTNESPHGFLQDMLRKEYLGEAAVQVADWFPNSEPVEWSPDLEVCPRPYR